MKLMFSLQLCILLALNGYSQRKNDQPLASDTKTYIKGKITGYEKNDDNGFVSFRSYDLNGRMKDTAIAIGADGGFSHVISQPFAGDLGLMFERKYVDFYAGENEEVGVLIDAKRWQGDTSLCNAIVFSGRSARISKAIQNYRYAVQHHHFRVEPDMSDTALSEAVFAFANRKRVQEELNFVDSFLAKQKLVEPGAVNWFRNRVIYEAATNIAFYCFAGKRNDKITHEDLMEYTSFAKPDNSSALNNSAYYGFNNMLLGDIQIITNLNPVNKILIKENGNNRVTVFLNKIDQYITGYAKQLMYAGLYNARNKDCAPNLSRFETIIIDPYLKRDFDLRRKTGVRIFEAFNLFEKLKKLPGGDKFVARFDSIAGQQKDKFVFMDFWGSWCGPCMHEMPVYPDLIKSLDSLPVTFLFLAVETTEKKIRETKEKNKINAVFISLNGNETRLLNNALSFSAYPAHFLLDPVGNVVNEGYSGITSGTQLNPEIVRRVRAEILK